MDPLRILNPTVATFVLVALVIATFTGCNSKAPTSHSASERTYSIRGIVEQLPGSEQGGVPFLLRHEAIPDFVNVYGEKAPMAAMTMPFAVADGVSLDGLTVGDAVAFELSVDWEKSPGMAVTAIAKLPPGTALDLADE